MGQPTWEEDPHLDDDPPVDDEEVLYVTGEDAYREMRWELKNGK